MSNLNLIHGNKGFTLIELLVVFSVIAMLSSIVLASLNNARIKANNSRIIQNTQQLRNQIEIGRSSNGKYPNLIGSSYSNGTYVLARQAELTTNDKFMPLINDILRINGATYPAGYGGPNTAGGSCGEVYSLNPAFDSQNKLRIFVDSAACANSGAGPASPASGYAIYATLFPSTGYFCIDSSGKTTRAISGFAPNSPTNPVICQ